MPSKTAVGLLGLLVVVAAVPVASNDEKGVLSSFITAAAEATAFF
jgi:hypothetical protein